MMTLLKSKKVLGGAALAGVFAFLLAVGLNQILARVLALPDGAEVSQDELAVAQADASSDDSDAETASSSSSSSSRRPRRPSKSSYVSPIVKRSVFDSSAIGVVSEPVGPDGKTDLNLVLLATVVAEPNVYSSALISQSGRNADAFGYGIGDKLPGGDGTVSDIQQKRVLIKRSDGRQEYLQMGDESKPASRPKPEADKGGEEEGISKDGDTTIVEQSVVDDALQNIDQLATKIRVVPHKGTDGNIDGYRLSAIRRGSLFDKLGIKNGDILHGVNGMELSSTDAAFQAYQSLQNQKSFSFDVTRRGKKSTFQYEIR